MPNSSAETAVAGFDTLSFGAAPADGIGGPGDGDRRGAKLAGLGVAGSVLVHLLIGLWVAGLLIPGLKNRPNEPISVQIVRPENAPPEPSAGATPPSPQQPATEAAPPEPPAPAESQKSDATPDPKGSPGKATNPEQTDLTDDERQAMITQAKFCWNVPPGWTDPRQVSVTVRFLLNPDGSLRGKPVVVEFAANTLGLEAANNAVEAVIACAPFKLPADKYEEWKDTQLRFEP